MHNGVPCYNILCALPLDAKGYAPIRSPEEEAAIERLRQKAENLRQEIERAKIGEKPDYEHGEPKPIPNSGTSMHDLVILDMLERKRFGLSKYGTLLQAHNGRKALRDAYEEILDLAVYLRQAIEEQDSEPTAIQVLQSEVTAAQNTTRPCCSTCNP
jgi:hypothetical protein